MIFSKLKFYSNFKKSVKEAESYKTPRQGKINKLEAELKAAREHGHAQRRKLNEKKQHIKRLGEEIKLLKYDNNNLKEDIKALRAHTGQLKKDLAIARELSGYVKKSEALREVTRNTK